jgi:hypothetical protein
MRGQANGGQAMMRGQAHGRAGNRVAAACWGGANLPSKKLKVKGVKVEPVKQKEALKIELKKGSQTWRGEPDFSTCD